MFFLLFINCWALQPLYTWVKDTNMEGLIPAPRGGHSANVIGRTMYIFGGCNTTQFCYSDLHSYNTETKLWKRLNSTGDLPTSRGDHVSVQIGTKILIFGGSNRGMEYNDLYEYDAITDHWTNLMPEGEKPPGRSSAAGALDSEGNFFITGGYSSQGYLNDLWVYSRLTNKWTKFITSGDAPTPRELHSFSISDKIGYLFGGFHSGGVSSELYILDIELMSWYRARDDGFLPDGREGHISLVLSEYLFIQGGCNFAHDICYDDMFVLDLVSLWWVKLENKEFSPLPAQKERARGVDVAGELIIFGGCYLDKHCFNDVIRINTGIRCDCKGNGVCRDGICVCFKGYSGSDCSVRPKCKENCLGRGFCTNTGDCDCYPGYKGKICEYESECPQNCTSLNNGLCQPDGSCLCNKGYSGPSCTCECANGFCFDKGCVCEPGWSGKKCDISEPQIAESSSNIEQESGYTEQESNGAEVQPKETDQSSQNTPSQTDLNQTEPTQAVAGAETVLPAGNNTNAEDLPNNPCDKCLHGECVNEKCYCSPGYTGANCDQMTKGVALIYVSSLTIIFILAGAIAAYCCISPESFFKEKEEYPLIRKKNHT